MSDYELELYLVDIIKNATGVNPVIGKPGVGTLERNVSDAGSIFVYIKGDTMVARSPDLPNAYTIVDVWTRSFGVDIGATSLRGAGTTLYNLKDKIMDALMGLKIDNTFYPIHYKNGTEPRIPAGNKDYFVSLTFNVQQLIASTVN